MCRCSTKYIESARECRESDEFEPRSMLPTEHTENTEAKQTEND